MKRIILTCSLVVGLGTVAACGSSQSSGSSGAASATTSGTSTASAATHFTGSPIKIMIIGVRDAAGYQQPELFSGAQAGTDAVNAAGGVNGHQLDLIQCDSNLDPNQEQACLNSAVSDKVSAVVGSNILFSTEDVLERAHIPLIASAGLTQAEFSSPVAYPYGGEFTWFTGQVAMAKEAGVKSAAIYTTNIAAAKFGVTIFETAMKQAGIKLTSVIEISNSTTDYSAPAQTAMSGNPQAVFTGTGANNFAPFAQALLQAGYSGKIYSFSSEMTPSAAKVLGSLGNGILVACEALPASDTGNPAVAKFLAAMNAYEPGALQDELSGEGYSGVEIFANLMAKATSFTGADVMAALNKVSASNPVQAGTFGTFIGTGTSPVSGYPRLLNYKFIPASVQSGQVVATDSAFQDPFKVVSS
jgi:branched-chain amino acid transport system substrate-binding protein